MANDLESKCDVFIPGNRKAAPAEYFAEVASWCENNDIQHDVYGSGELIQSLNRKQRTYWALKQAYLSLLAP